ncbi:MAG: cytidylate kinase-like family protein [Chlorobi bacterium]|nr:cytidylate kinase-like family protein [Chlorobiota bacterium]
MPYDLMTYFDQRFSKATKKPVIKEPGPFITISRETGCNATAIAQELIKTLKQYGKTWQYVNKEILEESARELNLKESKIEHIFDSRARTHLDEILDALSSRYYKNDKMVRKTISEVLRHFAREGNIIIVGRASVSTTRDIDNGLHIRLVAPYEWRVNSLKKRKAFENTDVEAFIKEHDEKKKRLIEQFCGKKFHEVYFDLTINRETFNTRQIIAMIVEAMKLKNLL